MKSISLLSPPSAGVPGTLAVAETIGNSGAIRLIHAEWVDEPGNLCINRIAAALDCYKPRNLELWRDGTGQLPKDWRAQADYSDVLIVCADNFWLSIKAALDKAGIWADDIIRISTGKTRHQKNVPRNLLLDLLRDSAQRLTVDLPAERHEGSRMVTSHELRAALLDLAMRPRSIDEESGAEGMDRGEALVLAVAMAVDQLTETTGYSFSGEVNAHYRGR